MNSMRPEAGEENYKDSLLTKVEEVLRNDPSFRQRIQQLLIDIPERRPPSERIKIFGGEMEIPAPSMEESARILFFEELKTFGNDLNYLEIFDLVNQIRPRTPEKKTEEKRLVFKMISYFQKKEPGESSQAKEGEIHPHQMIEQIWRSPSHRKNCRFTLQQLKLEAERFKIKFSEWGTPDSSRCSERDLECTLCYLLTADGFAVVYDRFDNSIGWDSVKPSFQSH